MIKVHIFRDIKQMKNIHFFLALFLCIGSLSAQNAPWGWTSHLPNKFDIPFEYKNNMIIVNVLFQKTFPLKFIFDTGAEHTILSRKEITDILGLQYQRAFKLVGADMSQDLTAHLVMGTHMEIGKKMLLPFQPILVLEDDYFRFEEVTGLKIHGVLGADIFRTFILKINYQRQVITLMKPSWFNEKKPVEDFTAIPIEITKYKPYINCPLKIYQDSSINVKLLLDSGATIALILNTNTHDNLKLPPNVLSGNIGLGLGGFLEGFMGRVESLTLDEFYFKEVLTNFQDLPPQIDTSLLNGRNGIIGNQILSRFTIIIDYWNEMLYLKPNRNFDASFKYDKSGAVIIAGGIQLNQFIVHDVIENTPASIAGLRVGDEIRNINWTPAAFFSLRDIISLLSRKEGKKIRMIVKRNGVRHKIVFRLKKLI